MLSVDQANDTLTGSHTYEAESAMQSTTAVITGVGVVDGEVLHFRGEPQQLVLRNVFRQLRDNDPVFNQPVFVAPFPTAEVLAVEEAFFCTKFGTEYALERRLRLGTFGRACRGRPERPDNALAQPLIACLIEMYIILLLMLSQCRLDEAVKVVNCDTFPIHDRDRGRVVRPDIGVAGLDSVLRRDRGCRRENQRRLSLLQASDQFLHIGGVFRQRNVGSLFAQIPQPPVEVNDIPVAAGFSQPIIELGQTVASRLSISLVVMQQHLALERFCRVPRIALVRDRIANDQHARRALLSGITIGQRRLTFACYRQEIGPVRLAVVPNELRQNVAVTFPQWHRERRLGLAIRHLDGLVETGTFETGFDDGESYSLLLLRVAGEPVRYR